MQAWSSRFGSGCKDNLICKQIIVEKSKEVKTGWFIVKSGKISYGRERLGEDYSPNERIKGFRSVF
jgi:hypothetical protein